MQRLDLTKRLLISCIVVLASIVVGVYFADLYLAYFGTDALTRLRMQRADARGIDFDRRSIDQVIRDLRSNRSNKAVPMVGTHITLGLGYGDGIPMGSKTLLPLGGVSNRTTIMCNELGEWTSFYTSDKRGFNNPSGVWDEHVEIAIIGDPFTQGACVAERDQWVTKIRARYPRTLNLGIGGNLLSVFASFQEFLPELQPKVVLWTYYEGDDLVIDRELKSPILLRYLDEDDFRQDLTSYQDDIDGALDQIIDRRLESSEQFNFAAFVKLYNLRSRFGATARGQAQQLIKKDPERIEILKRLLARAHGMVERWNGALYFIYLPQSARFLQADANVPAAIFEANAATLSPYYEDVVESVLELGIPLIDLVPVFQSTADPTVQFPLGLPGHYSEEGYRLVADAVLESLSAHEWGSTPGTSRPRPTATNTPSCVSSTGGGGHSAIPSYGRRTMSGRGCLSTTDVLPEDWSTDKLRLLAESPSTEVLPHEEVEVHGTADRLCATAGGDGGQGKLRCAAS